MPDPAKHLNPTPSTRPFLRIRDYDACSLRICSSFTWSVALTVAAAWITSSGDVAPSVPIHGSRDYR